MRGNNCRETGGAFLLKCIPVHPAVQGSDRGCALGVLLQSGESAKRAAEVCGFNDYSVFYKAYVKHFVEKPSAFAKDAII